MTPPDALRSHPRAARATVLVLLGALLAGGLVAPAVAASARSAAVAAPAPPAVVHDVLVDPCASPSGSTASTTGTPAGLPAGTARCFALARRSVVTDPRTGATRPATPAEIAAADAAKPAGTATVSPITPAQLQQIYGVAGRSAPAGATVGIVDAYDAPAVESDLALFRSANGLPACTTANGCFRKVDQRGATVPAGKSQTSSVKPVYNDKWQLEISLDTQAVSAMCPSCSILLVEADDTSLTASLGPAVLTAQALGATVVSNSFGGTESADEGPADRDYWSRLSVPVFAASGDKGHADNDGSGLYPAVSPSVVTVGGTSMTLSGSTVAAESAWSTDSQGSASGSGCSVLFPRPAFQSEFFTRAGITPSAPDPARCTTLALSPQVPSRAYADLSALADPYAPGFPMYLGGAATTAGGTSLAVQLVAALAAYAGARPTGSGIDQVAYRTSGTGAATGVVDVVGGSNRGSGDRCTTDRMCNAVAGWDGPTGLGTVRGTGLFAPLLTVAAPTAVPGGAVGVSGANLVPGETVTFTATVGAAAPVGAGQATVAADGTYQGTATVPGSATGAVTVTATGATSGLTASRTVTVPAAGLTVPAAPLAPGQRFTATATALTVGEAVTFRVAGGPPVAATVGADGSASAWLTVPLTASGTPTVTVTGRASGRRATAPVTVAVAALTASPTTVAAGDTVTLRGAGFGVGDAVSVAGAAGETSAVTADAAGAFTATLVVPAGTAPTASYAYTATASGGSGRQATTAVTVGGDASATLPASIAAGASATLAGTGFTPGETVTVAVDTGAGQLATPSTLTADPYGTVSTTVTVPATACPVASRVTLTGAASGRTAVAVFTTPPGASLSTGCSLATGAALTSPSGQYRLAVGTDGNLVLTAQLSATPRVLWSTGTTGAGAVLTMQSGGNLVLSAGGQTLWSTSTSGSGFSLRLQDDGNLVVVNAAGKSRWSRGLAGTDVLLPGETLQPGFFLHSLDSGYRLVMEAGGNLAEYTAGGRAVWSTGTSGANPTTTMTRAGNVAVTAGGRTVFTTKTSGTGAQFQVQTGGAVVVLDAAGAVVWHN